MKNASGESIVKMSHPMLKQKSFRSKSGFSLIEILIVISLIALIGSLVVVNVDGLLRGLGDRPIDQVFRMALREARYQSSAQKSPVWVQFDDDAREFILAASAGGEINRFSYRKSEESETVDVTFFQILPQEGTNFGGADEVMEINRIQFNPDRSSTPFRIQYQLGSEQWTEQYDPFSDILLESTRN